MDEMQLIRDMNDHHELPSAEELAPARAQLLAAAAAERAQGQPAVHRIRRFGSRARLGLGGAIGIAAAVAAVTVLAPFNGQAPDAHAEAVRVLQNAADAARALPDTEPRPDQFVYTKAAMGKDDYESWMSVDGTHDSLIARNGETLIPGCKNGNRAVTDANTSRQNPGEKISEPCAPDPAVDTSLPADADAIFHRIDTAYGDDVNAMAKEVLHLIDKSHTRSEVRAAIFEAATRIPGLTMVENATDAAGRTGTGITWTTEGGGSEMLIFDADNHVYLGSEDTAVLDIALVDEIGQRP
ncbi:hypothetical protein SAMN05216266_13026 [Amycolatopsis marina]|uniref:Uncharacterized protein n=1 Tax=Amycolatopsis marina TaxID=490629 RepID=A0A1I1CP76_9PSEU|nr:CU044_5270 family protein [Amycolatopsis marina]SFB62233.1 hypothetical protein SAMN05216266_13026 [Amycolatopsis marina]